MNYEWISVNDRLPEPWKIVLLTDRHEHDKFFPEREKFIDQITVGFRHDCIVPDAAPIWSWCYYDVKLVKPKENPNFAEKKCEFVAGHSVTHWMPLPDLPQRIPAFERGVQSWWIVNPDKRRRRCANCRRVEPIEYDAPHCRWCGAKMEPKSAKECL